MTRVSWSVAALSAAALSIAAMGVGLGWLLGSRGEAEGTVAGAPGQAPQARTEPSGAGAPAPLSGTDAMPAAPSALPPYIASAPVPGGGGGSDRHAAPPVLAPLPPGVPGGDPSQRIQRLQELAGRLDRMRQGGRVDAAEVDKILGELEKAWGSPEIAGIRIDALRRNMQAANEALRLHEDIERLRHKKEPTDEDRKAIEARQKELMELARRMNVGVVPAPGALDTIPAARAKP